MHERARQAFDPFDHGPGRDPWTQLRELRDRRPALEISPGVWYVTRHEDVRRVLLDADTFSSAGNFTLDDGRDPETQLIVQLDPPRHGELRRVLLGGFTRGAIRDADPWIDARLAQLCDAFAARGRADLMRELALPLTSHVIARLVGVPVADAETLAGWVREVSAHRPRPVHDLPGWRRLAAYMQDLVRRRAEAALRDSRGRGDEQDRTGEDEGPAEGGVDGSARDHDGERDMIDRLLAARIGDQPLGRHELPYHVYQLFTAGTETTAYTIGILVHELLREPGAWAALDDPAYAAAAVEEGLRFASAIRHDFRIVRAPVEIAGRGFAPGDRVVASLESANRDERVWTQPERFRPGRSEASRTLLAFGAGIHLCLGAHLARTEVAAALRTLRARFPSLQLAPRFEPRCVRSRVLNGLESLDVVWNA